DKRRKELIRLGLNKLPNGESMAPYQRFFAQECLQAYQALQEARDPDYQKRHPLRRLRGQPEQSAGVGEGG
ncbi:hypothetical protein LCGC14_2340190, partial [marine sediment metagenome]